MIKEIAYQGYSVVPSDYESADGQMAASLNLIHEEGAMRPVLQPKMLVEFKTGEPYPYEVKYVHKNAAYEHLIVTQEDTSSSIIGRPHCIKLYWIDRDSIGEDGLIIDAEHKSDYLHNICEIPDIENREGTAWLTEKVNDINAIGNTLVLLCNYGMHYCLWSGSEYKYLGDHLPELPLSFGLKGEYKISDEFFVRNMASTEPEDGHTVNLTEYDANEATGDVLAKVNSFIAKYTTGDVTTSGKFIFPFFVRYAYRLFDGSLTMHSSPVLMVTQTDVTPNAFVSQYEDDPDSPFKRAACNIESLVFNLDYICLDGDAKDTLIQWSDIVQSVDVFVSAPIYTYKQSGKVEQWAKKLNTEFGYTVSFSQRTILGVNVYKNYYAKQDSYSLPSAIQKFHFLLPRYSDDEVYEQIKSCGNFYFLKSINLQDIAVHQDEDNPSDADRVVIEIPEGYLPTLTSREVMTDDYDSHAKLIPKNSYVYNSRLNIAALTKQLATPLHPNVYKPYETGSKNVRVYFYIKKDQREYVVATPLVQIGSGGGAAFQAFRYLYYPDGNAYKALVVGYDDNPQTNVEIPLKRHDFLNGAYFFDGWEPTGQTGTIPELSTDLTVAMYNKIYTSEVNNPFFFPVTGINTVGSGTILAMSAATKALSQGQFGQFPLYVFSDDGVWALEVSPTGTFSSSHPVTRDVCINADSITQIDTAVLFATERGIMLVQGSDTVCISDALFSEHPFDVLDLPHASVLHTMLGHNTDTCLPTKPFIGFLSGCQMLYDYVHQHIIVFNPSKTVSEGETTYDYTYAYVYSRKSEEWGMMYTNVSSRVNSYPEAMAMTHDGHFVSFAHAAADNDYKGLFITRPIKLGNPDVLKSIHTVIQRGMCQRGDVNTVLWGSRDLYNWYLIGSSTDNAIRNLRGTPYKYFRIGGVATLPDGKSLFGVSVEADPRHTSVMQ